ncbi:Caffeine resistance protein 5 [Psilocybe cubensis]|uniref:Major facilitator superfamily (MFS) profile domain-containing protein n=2 Tax=Psilocybe cubensis TaxID=181762 RepID=A0A8H7XKC1_PSICU|nr:Caffeine resistance protein 5 [Psilocybe cubensis]KAH9477360.1 Caffeine resistance protein 5 [Psilocybe cubensis]
MSDIFRDSTVGALINYATNGRLFPFPDQRPEWQLPANLRPKSHSRDSDVKNRDKVAVESAGSNTPTSRNSGELEKGPAPTEPVSDKPVVGWYDENDQENPMNWSLFKRCAVVAMTCLLTTSIYLGSAIYTASIPDIMEVFNCSQTTATAGLSLYVIAYGIGPMFLSPISEIPSVGRREIYIVTLIIYTALQVPTLYANNIHTLLAMRFFAGFFGSPALASGGATIQDMFHFIKLPNAMILWSVTALCGPLVGPIMGGYAAAVKGWKWPLYELLWLVGFTLILLIFWYPETNAETILLRRARRIRARTGNQELYSEGEVRQSHLKSSQVLYESLLRPFQLMTEPVVLYLNLYISLGYAIFYLWFEAFPVVYIDIYHFSLGASALPFLGLLVTAILTGICYLIYNKKVIEATFLRTGAIIPESRLTIALFAAPFGPVALFIFGWTARESIHWMAPTIGAALFLPGLLLIFQGAVVYLPMSYPRYAASILAGNGLFRAVLGGAFPLFGRELYTSLGVGGGCSLLAGITIAFWPGLWYLWRYGAEIRAKSKYANF